MAESYEVLSGKYRTAIVSIHELEQERDLYEKQADDMRQDYKRMEKQIKELCETILKKEREKKDNKKWMNMPTMEMIERAQESLEHYFPDMEEQIKKMLKQNEERRKEIESLRKQLDEVKDEDEQKLKDMEKEKDAAINALTEKLKTGRMEEEDIEQTIQTAESRVQKAVKQKRKNLSDKLNDINGGQDEDDAEEAPKKEHKDSSSGTDYAINVEAKDGIDEVVKNSVASVMVHGTYQDISGPKVFEDAKTKRNTKNAIKEAVKDMQENQDSEISKELQDMTDMNKLHIRILGETGYSEFDRIVSYGMEHFPEKVTKAALYSSNMQLKRRGFLSQTNISVPGIPKLGLYKLTQKGQAAYQYLFSKEAKEASMDEIIRNHTSLEHGYGIMQVAKLIQDMPFIKKTKSDVVYITRTKDYTVKTGEHTSYIPDIVIVSKKDGKETRVYIEYETGKCTETDFFAKCYKMATFSKYINIAVPDAGAKDITVQKAKKWKQTLLDKKELSDKTITINVSTYADLKAGLDAGECANGIAWQHGEIITKNMARKKEEKKS